VSFLHFTRGWQVLWLGGTRAVESKPAVQTALGKAA
jgi:hypothetical protein